VWDFSEEGAGGGAGDGSSSRRGKELKVGRVANLRIAVCRNEILEAFVYVTHGGRCVQHGVPVTHRGDVWDWVCGEWDAGCLKAANCPLVDFMRWGGELNVGTVEIFALKQVKINVVAVEVLEVVLEMVLPRKGVGNIGGLAVGRD